MDGKLRHIIKAVVVVGCEIAFTDVFSYHSSYRGTTNKLAAIIAGTSTGYFVGKVVGDAVVNGAERAMKAYNEGVN